ncbi:hypothetical protein GCM10022223_30610 [Kineosporia mesophila]|uniref:Glyoxalase-like domain-containing protein n=2 Tax=Kineosporia mesophila TaxID=566012 RepID=A0ABP6ZL44_9ACTN|nr:VOC family protein [Kineosporia mesophila]
MTIFLDFPIHQFGPGVEFWRRVTGSRLSAPRGGDGEFVTLLPSTGDAYLRAQALGSGPARLHLDLHVDPERRADAVAQAVALGASPVLRGGEHDVLTSPGGYTFCFVPWEGERAVPSPEDNTRLDQLCLDIPPALWDSESRFWSGLTGWELHPLGDSAFIRLRQPAGLPVKLLLQRLDDAGAAGGAVTSHLDLAAPGRATLAPAHAAAGAVVGPANEEWTVMTDPLGRPYCLTGRTP